MDLGALVIERAGIVPPAHVALVGAGGKTTTMLAVLGAGSGRGWRCAAATTTKVGVDQIPTGVPFLHAVRDQDKLVGVGAPALDQEFASGRWDVLVVEADGARGKVVKAPGEHEPVIPSSATHVVALVGADAVDRVIEDVAHRPMLVAALCGCGPYERLTVDRLTTLLTSSRGGRKSVPSGAAFFVGISRIGPRQSSAVARLVAALEERSVVAIELPAPGAGE